MPLCVPMLHGNEWVYVKECLDTNWVSTAGPFVARFEAALAERLGARDAVACASGTAALHLALLVTGVQPGDEVIVPTLTFIAPANAVRYVGAHPVFVDVDARYWQIDTDKLAEFLASAYAYQNGKLRNRTTGRTLTAIISVDLLGHPSDADRIAFFAQQYGLRTIEDATESLGARYKSRWAGRLADVGCLSFNGNKIVTTGGGGALVSDRLDWIERARYLSTQAKDDPLEQIHASVGFNYRLTNLQAAVGVAQLEFLDQHVDAKRKIACIYREQLSGVPGVMFQEEADWAQSTFWLFTAVLDPAHAAVDSRTALRRLMHAGIECRLLWQPLHLSPAHGGAFASRCAVAESLAQRALSLPSSVGLSRADQERVVAAFKAALA